MLKFNVNPGEAWGIEVTNDGKLVKDKDQLERLCESLNRQTFDKRVLDVPESVQEAAERGYRRGYGGEGASIHGDPR